jgi:DNA helicase HerA-like ATPase
VAATVELLDDSDFETIYEIDDKTSIILGNDIFDTDKKIGANVNYLMPSHVGVFGNTGSGKSNTLAK